MKKSKTIFIVIGIIIFVAVLSQLFGDKDSDDITNDESNATTTTANINNSEDVEDEIEENSLNNNQTKTYQSILDDYKEKLKDVLDVIDVIEENSLNNNQTKTYQSIFDDYTEKLKNETTKLVEEYNKEALTNTSGLAGLAELCTNKIEVLAIICNDGISEMAEIVIYTGSGKYDEYEEWAGKLQNVYMEESGKITDAYMESVK